SGVTRDRAMAERLRTPADVTAPRQSLRRQLSRPSPTPTLPDMVCTTLRSLSLMALAVGLAFSAVSALAQQYPTRPIRFVQGFAAGGNADAITRVLGAEMSKSLGQPVIFDARVGAGGNIAAEQVARAEPDGYTLLLVTTAHLVSPALYN